MINLKNNEFYLNKTKVANLMDYDNLIFVDVETSNDNKIILDFSYMIFSCKRGSIIESGAYLISETWNTNSLRLGKYSKEKQKEYRKKLKSGKITLITKDHLYNKINKLIKDYNLKVWVAYNGAFDLEALYRTFDYKNNRMKLWKTKCWKGGNFKPLFKQLDLLDLWTFASAIYKTKEYQTWYDKNNLPLSSKGNRKTNVEVVSKYLKDNKMFVESHIGIEDLENEYAIFMSCVWCNNHKNILLNYKGLWGAWKLAQNNPPKKESKIYRKVLLHLLDNKE